MNRVYCIKKTLLNERLKSLFIKDVRKHSGKNYLFINAKLQTISYIDPRIAKVKLNQWHVSIFLIS